MIRSKGAKITDEMLFAAVKRKNVEVVKFLVSKGADVNVKAGVDVEYVYGTPDAMVRSEHGDVEIDEIYENYGHYGHYGHIMDGVTPLHVAVMVGNIEIAKFLVSKGADVHAKDRCGATPLHYAKIIKQTDIEKYLSGIK